MHETCLLISLARSIKINALAASDLLKSVMYSLIPNSFHQTYNFIQLQQESNSNTIVIDDDNDFNEKFSDSMPDFYCVKALMKWFHGAFSIDKATSNEPFPVFVKSEEDVLASIKRKKMTLVELQIVCFIFIV